MSLAAASSIVFALLASAVVVFQLALALGAPWGAYAMGGAFPGRMPAGLRVAAVVQAAVLLLLAVVVLSSAGQLLPGLVADLPWLAWLPVAISAIAVVLNASTRSAGERWIWLPVALVMLASSLGAALS